ncbi:MAG: hypothetical protein K8F92_06745 [Hyphomicrobium sp.]|uniref:hypothetical protein n=1 Tax=Hyphomicrobium sp. TaxID=82 RepID=UPI0013248A15|nr:hypothetical protein [Hyphomicrobium sp.]KAB2944040.1 MAG: hypothetical protein F9K20_01030 [Hyphomicrobium sp.]MBZ0209333.1 hypothetical protein [Hyphomicrobium sp.]
MSLQKKTVAIAMAAITAAGAQPALAAEFTFNEKTNADLAKKLKIPVYFAVPASARASLPKDIKTTDKLIDFKHPDALKAQGDVGLRLVVAKRSGLAKRLGQSGLVQTGDILLTFRTEWGGAGAYPNIQMGISHTGFAYVGKDGVVRNLDNPLDGEYVGRGDLTSQHYRTLNYLHIIRPRSLTDAQKANLYAWAKRLNDNSKRVYPSQISFNQDYNAPKFRPGRPLTFVKEFGQIALGQGNSGKPLDLYCSEFVWSLLSLRNCDPAKSDGDFNGSRVPSCIKEPMEPMKATGNVLPNHGRRSYSGLADGPLLVIDQMDLPDDQRRPLLDSIFVENPAGLANMSVGHRKVAEEMQPRFERLKNYYIGMTGRMWQHWRARLIGTGFNWAGIAENYSPTSYLINSLLPANNNNRTMDYVATVVIE